MSVAIGIDPGKKGAMAVIYHDGHVEVIPFDEKQYIEHLDFGLVGGGDIKCCIEQVHSLPREGVKSVWAFGQNYGWIMGVLDTLGIPYQAVPPNKWKREYSLLKADKKQSIEVCHRLFPNVSLKRTERCKTDSSDMAEALLMAEYARRHF